jgi:hypothetical protein
VIVDRDAEVVLGDQRVELTQAAGCGLATMVATPAVARVVEGAPHLGPRWTS